MILENYSIEEFLGIIAFFPLFIYLILIIFDGFGTFRDFFYISERKERYRK